MRKKSLIVGIVIAVLLSIAVLVWRGSRTEPQKAEEKHDPNGVEVTTEAQKNAGIVVTTASEQRIQQLVKMTGVVAPDQARVSHIVPLSQGVVEDVFVQLGARVQRGQPLLVYDNIELGESVGEFLNLRASLEKAKAQQEVARRAVERANSLIEVQAISPRDFELRKAEYEQAQAEVESRRAEMARAEEKLHRFGLTETDVAKLTGAEQGGHRTASHNTLRAPLSGVVTTYDVSKGEVVNREKELFTIVDTSSVWVLADVYEKDIQFVARGGECNVAVASYPNELFKGKITYLSDALDPSSRTAKLRCVLPNAGGRLKLEMFATVTVATNVSRTGVTVPATALQDIGGEQVVFIQVEPTKFEKRAVKLGERDDQRAEVLSGIRSGEKIVADGSFYLKSALMREQIGGEE